jgi:membrane peptidoglycan carboxypeptidase
MDDPDELYSLDECTTIDKKITKRATKLLGNLIKYQQMENAQIVILDAKSGRLKTWVRLDRDTEKDESGKLLVHSCTGSLTKPFHTVMALENDSLSLDSTEDGVSYRQAVKACDNQMMRQAIQNGYRRSVADRKWRELTDTDNPSTSPFIMAVGYNSLANDGTMIIPTMKADSVNVEEDVFSANSFVSLIELLKVDRVASPQLAWLSTDSEWLGYATTEDIFAEDDKEHNKVIGKQIAFAGCFPVEGPRYTICIVGDMLSVDAAPALFQDVVNPLSKWLLKR